jgi:hypothetical protein
MQRIGPEKGELGGDRDRRIKEEAERDNDEGSMMTIGR